MDNELEALVGHLFIVGGRAVSAASPGSIAMPPPRRTARGRDEDTLFALVSLGSGQHQTAQFYEELTDTLSSKYFSTAGSITAALRESISTLNDSLRGRLGASASPLAVGLACGILRETELTIAMVGPGRCFLIREDFIERLPDDNDLAEGMLALGHDIEPDIRFYRRQVTEGDFLMLVDSSLNRLTDTTLRHAVSAGSLESGIDNLRSVAGQSTTAIIIKLVSPLAEGEAETEVEAPRRRPAVPPLPAFGAPTPGVPPRQPPAPTPLPPAEAEPGEEPPPPPHRSIGERLKVFTEGGARQQADDGEPAGMRRLGLGAAQGVARASDAARSLVEKVLPDEEVDNPLAQRLNLSVSMQIGVAVAVAIIVALLTTAVYRVRGQTSRYFNLVKEAEAEMEAARAAGNDQATARAHWETALYRLDEASELRAPSPEIIELQNQALTVLDSYDHVTRVNLVLLREYMPGATLRGPIVQGVNLYLIDTVNDILYREDLTEDGMSLVGNESQIITRQGELVGDQVVGGLIDLTWMEEGGAPQRNVLAVLSRNGLLVTYSPSWDTTAMVLPGFEAWQDPRAIAIYDRDLYILDAGANEIWRYEAGNDTYASAPQRYFTDYLPALMDAVAMQIDTNGNVYVLHASGLVSKYFQGREEVFEMQGLPQPVLRPSALFLNLSPYDTAFYVADPGGGRLYTTTTTGVFLNNYKDAVNEAFTALSGVFSQDRPAYIYVTAGNRLYAFSRP